jgi:hypothetical protein
MILNKWKSNQGLRLTQPSRAVRGRLALPVRVSAHAETPVASTRRPRRQAKVMTDTTAALKQVVSNVFPRRVRL